jgi:hypothetical protein
MAKITEAVHAAALHQIVRGAALRQKVCEQPRSAL